MVANTPSGGANRAWHIAYGLYRLTVDRRTLTCHLTEGRTGTVWAADTSLGWMDLKDRETGAVRRYPFGEMAVVSVSEKAGPQGKRILFGLDCHGVPVDLYLICSEREIQLVLEASRDSQTHQVEGFGLVPGLCRIPPGENGYLVLPHGEGVLLPTGEASPGHLLPVWNSETGLTMPFLGAVRERSEGGASALTLITDSAYAYALYAPAEQENPPEGGPEGGQSLTFCYQRDPERRRLDLRIIPLPGGDYIQCAITYRNKLISDRNHLTLRNKVPRHPGLAAFLQGQAEGEFYPLEKLTTRLSDADPRLNRWQVMEERLERIEQERSGSRLIGDSEPGDWACAALDFRRESSPASDAVQVPLMSVVYHDCVLQTVTLTDRRQFLRALLRLALGIPPAEGTGFPELQDALALLSDLVKRTSSAFLTGHRFLTGDRMVEEAIYSDRTRVVINLRESESYENKELSLPPLGFYLYHSGREQRSE